MSNKYKAVPIFWTADKGCTHLIKNLETLQDLLRDGWRVTRVDVPPDNNKSDISDTVLIYILEQAPDEETRKTINEETRKTINEARACLESHDYDCYGCEDVLDGSTTIGDALTYACATSNKERTAKLLYYMGQPPAPILVSQRETVADQVEYLWDNLGMCHAQGPWIRMTQDLIASKQTGERRK